MKTLNLKLVLFLGLALNSITVFAGGGDSATDVQAMKCDFTVSGHTQQVEIQKAPLTPSAIHLIAYPQSNELLAVFYSEDPDFAAGELSIEEYAVPNVSRIQNYSQLDSFSYEQGTDFLHWGKTGALQSDHFPISVQCE